MENNTKQIIKAVFSALWRYLLCFILGAMVMANCKGCEQENTIVPVSTKENKAILIKLDSLQFQNECHLHTIKMLYKRVAVLDSITKIIKPTYQKAKKDNRDFIQNNPCDSIGILTAYDATVAKCDTVILVDSLKINDLKKAVDQFEMVNKNFVSMLKSKEQQLVNKDIDLMLEQKKVKVQKRKKIAAIALGILAVITTVLVLK